MNNHKETQIKYSRISFAPDLLLPANSCDCHHHIFDRRYPWAPDDERNLPDARVNDYRAFQSWLGFTRHVLVQPSSYGADNRCLLDALKAFGENARGEAVVTPSVSDADLDTLADAGVTGIRFNFAAGSITTPEMLLPLAARVAERGWHVQVHASADRLWALRSVLKQVPGRLVIDHFFRLPQPEPLSHPAWKLAWELIDSGRCWVKLSALYHQSQRDDVSDMAGIIKGFLFDATERVVWGSDWPHPNLISANKNMPDDALILSRIAHWANNDRVRHRLFVHNPADLYGFNSSSS
ncbi:amidohydrolase family protein [Leclercia adecarboxylata]|uniref:amidohydrolase family protein n=1 Tax=Leclercia adecarboxylata TaxID=83655 RepID=UPI00057AD8AB|nr:amidohydrolase family protein [Leclercia adecarboxylata]